MRCPRFLIFSHSLTVLNGVFESSLIAFYSGTRDKSRQSNIQSGPKFGKKVRIRKAVLFASKTKKLTFFEIFWNEAALERRKISKKR